MSPAAPGFPRPGPGYPTHGGLSSSHAFWLSRGSHMSFLVPLALRLERFVYDGVCAVSSLSRSDGSNRPRTDPLASPLDGSRAPSGRE